TAEVRPSTWLGTNVDMSAATRSYSALASRPQVALVAAAPAPVAPSCRLAAVVAPAAAVVVAPAATPATPAAICRNCTDRRSSCASPSALRFAAGTPPRSPATAPPRWSGTDQKPAFRWLDRSGPSGFPEAQQMGSWAGS